MRLGYQKVYRMPDGYLGWCQAKAPIKQLRKEPELLGKNDFFPECRFVQVKEAKDRNYLKLDDSSVGVTLSDIHTEYIYVEIYNERCLGCIAEIKNYKILYQTFKNSSSLSQKVRIIGIGAGSTSQGVARFRKANGIPFPLFADPNWDIFECLGSPVLPTSYLLKLEKEGRRKIVFVQRGHIEKTERLINSLARLIH